MARRSQKAGPADGTPEKAPPEKPARSRSRPTRAAARRPAEATPAAPSTEGLAEALRALRDLAEGLRAHGDSLREAVQEIPRAADFQPLADHLYELARTAPTMIEHLEAFPRVAAPLGDNVRSLQDIAETLQALHGGFSDSLFRLPRPEDYEPLLEPLSRFASTAPDLVRSLDEVQGVATPLAATVQLLGEIASRLEAGHERLAALERERSHDRLVEPLEALSRAAPGLDAALASSRDAALRLSETTTRLEAAVARVAALAPAASPPASTPFGPESSFDLLELGALVDSARSGIVEALSALPAHEDYAALAAELHALAAVRPEVHAWLARVPSVSAPLAGSVQALRETASTLKAAHTNLLTLVERARQPPPPEQAVAAALETLRQVERRLPAAGPGPVLRDNLAAVRDLVGRLLARGA